jgi:hypothetical protein
LDEGVEEWRSGGVEEWRSEGGEEIGSGRFNSEAGNPRVELPGFLALE